LKTEFSANPALQNPDRFLRFCRKFPTRLRVVAVA
jgi:hypothetical protein